MNQESEFRSLFSDLPQVEFESFGPDPKDFTDIKRLYGEEKAQAIASLPPIDRKAFELFEEEMYLGVMSLGFDPFTNSILVGSPSAKEVLRAQIEKVLNLQNELRVMREQEGGG